MAEDYFLKIDGIEGESQDVQHKGEIELNSWSFGGTNVGVSQAHAGMGGKEAKFDAQDFQFTTRISKASPRFAQACASGQHFKGATLFARRGAERERQAYLTIKLVDIQIVSYQQNGSRGTDSPNEQVSLSYARIEIEYKEQKPDGSLGDPVRGGFDGKAGQRG